MPDFSLTQQIDHFRHWREQVAQIIDDYRNWLDETKSSDAIQDLRLYDLAESLKRDHLVLAFVAEFSRGKTETINALFFSDFNQRLLPSDPGRTTMCPNEIYWDEREEPCIKLLPIETRRQEDSLAYLKTNPQIWTKIRLDMNSPAAMKEGLATLVQKKRVSLNEARALGLWDENDVSMVQFLHTTGAVEVPVWRHALINYPHPLLKSGLVILDTPGLNTLGTEPELTLSIIPNAHAVIFLMATDTGVTKSDMQIWTQYIRHRASRKIAVLNKIDMLWDEMKTPEEIETVIDAQVALAAQQLNLPSSLVLAISAQKGLLAKIKKDEALLARSRLESLEQLLARNVVGAKHDILSKSILAETASMLKNSRKSAQQRTLSQQAHLEELKGLGGKNRAVVQSLLAKVSEGKKSYEHSVSAFNQWGHTISKTGERMLALLSPEILDRTIAISKQEIGDSWTTIGLSRGMKNLMSQTAILAGNVTQLAQEIRSQAADFYQLFHTQHGFDDRQPPVLEMDTLLSHMQELEKVTELFCSDPINVMTEKHFLVRRFFGGLVSQVQLVFAQAHGDTKQWLHDVPAPLKQQIAEHRAEITKRSGIYMRIHKNLDALQDSIRKEELEMAILQSQSARLDRMLLKLMQLAKPIEA